MENYTVQSKLPVFKTPNTTTQLREFFSKSDCLHYTTLQKSYIFQKSLSFAFRHILYSVLVSLLEKQEKNTVSYLACVKFKRSRNKFSFEPQYILYSSKKIKPVIIEIINILVNEIRIHTNLRFCNYYSIYYRCRRFISRLNAL